MAKKYRTFHQKGAVMWRRRWDSNPRDVLPSTRFRVELVMTTSILLHSACVSQALNYYIMAVKKKQGFFTCTAKFISPKRHLANICLPDSERALWDL